MSKASFPLRLSSRFHRRSRSSLRVNERGFTLLETSIAIAILAMASTALLGATLGSMSALNASRKRAAFVEVLNAEMEAFRSLPYDSVAVLSNDANLSSAYPNGKYSGFDAVVVTAGTTSATPFAAVSVIYTSPVKGVIVPYTVRRYVTWTDASGGSTHTFKRLDITVTWKERVVSRTNLLTSLLYPGGLGPPTTSPDLDPVAGTIGFTPATGIKASTTSVSFTVSGSSDPNGDPLTYTWDFGDGFRTTGGTTIAHTYSAPGTFSAQVTVSDGRGAATIATKNVSVGPSTTPAAPTAAFTLDYSSGLAPLTVNFDASGSTDPNGDGLTYTWNFGDSSPAQQGSNMTHKFVSVGTFSVQLTATDPSGQTNSVTHAVTTTPLNCDITDASFKNPSTNAAMNDVRATNGVPVNTSFQYTMMTNSGCSGLTVKLFYADGSAYATPLTMASEIDGVRTWQATSASTKAFSVGTGQTGQGYAADGTTFTFSYGVHS